MMPCKKTYFADEKTATEFVHRLQETSKRKVVPHRAYLCEKCFNWHITSLRLVKENNLMNQIDSLTKAIGKRNKEITEKETRIEELSDTVIRLNNKLRMYDRQAFRELFKKKKLMNNTQFNGKGNLGIDYGTDSLDGAKPISDKVVITSDDKEKLTENGCSDKEIEDIGKYMGDIDAGYGSYNEPKKLTRLLRLKVWFVKKFYGYSDDEYKRYKDKIDFENNHYGLNVAEIPLLQNQKQKTTNRGFNIQLEEVIPKPKSGISLRNKKIITYAAVLVGGLFLSYLINKIIKYKKK
jgi:hypothetical protein